MPDSVSFSLPSRREVLEDPVHIRIKLGSIRISATEKTKTCKSTRIIRTALLMSLETGTMALAPLTLGCSDMQQFDDCEFAIEFVLEESAGLVVVGVGGM